MSAFDPTRIAARLDAAIRRLPIRWRILGIAILNSAVALILVLMMGNGARVLSDAWADLRRVRESERFLANLNGDAERLQSLVHRYFAGNDPDVLARAIDLRDSVISRLRVQARLDPLLSGPTRPLTESTERFIEGFEELRTARDNTARLYESTVLGPARDMASLYAIVSDRVGSDSALIGPAMSRSREAYNAMVLATTSFYLSGNAAAGAEAKALAKLIKRTVPVMLDLSGPDDVQRQALRGLAARADLVETGTDQVATAFREQAALLRGSIDRNTEAISATVAAATTEIRDREVSAQARFDQTLADAGLKLSALALAFLVLVGVASLAIARSISEPLDELAASMRSVMAGQDAPPVPGTEARDEIGAMARAVDVFQENAVARRAAEAEMRRARDRAEAALAELRDTQTSLIEAEKFAALGGLVAGVAHEVNNPVGISLTVASSLVARCDDMEAELLSGQIRRSRLQDFTAGIRQAASQLVANLNRAGELVQSFKQVAVDRSQGERRAFDLREAVEQILASLRPTLRNAGASLVVQVEPGIAMESFPGPLGQILTNLFLNALLHGFDGRSDGTIGVTGRLVGADRVEIVFQDDGAGMNPDVQKKAFDPFFTTRRHSGGTGLGLHIVYNLVTVRLGGRITVSSEPGRGTAFTIVLPRIAAETDGIAGEEWGGGRHGVG